nr:hypothetical protein L204_03970 [Cryptococcus depauperatus CBS 7855]
MLTVSTFFLLATSVVASNTRTTTLTTTLHTHHHTKSSTVHALQTQVGAVTTKDARPIDSVQAGDWDPSQSDMDQIGPCEDEAFDPMFSAAISVITGANPTAPLRPNQSGDNSALNASNKLTNSKQKEDSNWLTPSYRPDEYVSPLSLIKIKSPRFVQHTNKSAFRESSESSQSSKDSQDDDDCYEYVWVDDYGNEITQRSDTELQARKLMEELENRASMGKRYVEWKNPDIHQNSGLHAFEQKALEREIQTFESSSNAPSNTQSASSHSTTVLMSSHDSFANYPAPTLSALADVHDFKSESTDSSLSRPALIASILLISSGILLLSVTIFSVVKKRTQRVACHEARVRSISENYSSIKSYDDMKHSIPHVEYAGYKGSKTQEAPSVPRL